MRPGSTWHTVGTQYLLNEGMNECVAVPQRFTSNPSCPFPLARERESTNRRITIPLLRALLWPFPAHRVADNPLLKQANTGQKLKDPGSSLTLGTC